LAELAFYPQRSTPARVISLNEPVVSAQIAAQVKALTVRVGDVVVKGGELARLDCADYKLARRIADGSLQALNARTVLAKQRLKRAFELEDKQLVSTDLLDERQANLTALQADQTSARAALQRAQLDESRCVIISPFNALITQRLSSEGQYATPGSALFKLIDLNQKEVSAQVFSEDAARLEGAKKFSLQHDGQSFALKLRSVLPVINANTRNREVRLEFLGKSSLPGASGKLLWQDLRPHLPAEVWLKRNGQLGLFILKQGQAHFVAVPTAKMGRANAVDLAVDTQIITKGHYALQPDQPVKLTDALAATFSQ